MLRGPSVSGQSAWESLGLGQFKIDTEVDPVTNRTLPKIRDQEMVEHAIIDFVNEIFARHREFTALNMTFAAQVNCSITNYRQIAVTRKDSGEIDWYNRISPDVFPLVQDILDSVRAGFMPPPPHGITPEDLLAHFEANPPSDAEILNAAAASLFSGDFFPPDAYDGAL